MGFKVDTAEIRKAIDSYQKIAATATEELSSAKTAMNGIITSNAMHGQVGQAIEADINNNQNAVIVGLADSYTAMSMEMTKLYQSFKEATGETSDNAILKQDVLEKASKKIDTLKEDHQEILSNITNIYSSVADLISLTTPKSTFNKSADEVKKYADKIIEKVTTFDSQQGNSANEDMLAKLKTQIQSAEKVGGLSYTDPQFLAFANSTSLAEEVQDYHSSVSKESEKLRKEKENDLNSMTPSEMIAKYGVNDPDVKKRINDINNGISYTALDESVKWSGYGQSLSNGVLQGLKITGNNNKVNALKMGSRNISTDELSRMGKRARDLEKRGDDLINFSNKVGNNKIWKGAGLVGSVVGVGFQYNEEMSKYNDVKRAVKNTVAKTAIQAGGTAIGGQIGAALGTAIPIPVLGTAFGALVGMGIGYAGSEIYDWIETGKAKKALDNISSKASKTTENIRKNTSAWFSNIGNSLGGAFS